MSQWNTNYQYVFVHGIEGWGQYDFQNSFLPYWGMRNGSLTKYLNKRGFKAYEASVDPEGSAWDRACELYAQLTGSVTDYGVEHSKRFNHKRFGKDFSKKPLVEKWDETNKINFVCHSFGGTTVRMLCQLLKDGSKTEMEATEKDISPLFTGGHEHLVYSITTLCTPHNGTTSYSMVDPEPQKRSISQRMIYVALRNPTDGRDPADRAKHDMNVYNARELNKGLSTMDDIYYFSYACYATEEQPDGTQKPVNKHMDKMLRRCSFLMGSTIVTEKDFTTTEEWFMNDGLVNTKSARAPFNAPQTLFNPSDIKKGIWNIMPLRTGDHMSLQGGFGVKVDVWDFYLEQLNRINNL